MDKETNNDNNKEINLLIQSVFVLNPGNLYAVSVCALCSNHGTTCVFCGCDTESLRGYNLSLV
jgi:hypothetical protein